MDVGWKVTVVDRIDKPKPHEPWMIKSAAESRDRGQEEHHPSQEDEFSSPGQTNPWSRLRHTEPPKQLLHLNRTDIRHFWFRKATLQRQSTLIDCDLELQDGRLYTGAQLFLPRIDDYFQFRGYVVGQEVPITTLVHEPVLEIAIPAARTHSPVESQRPAVTAVPQASPLSWWQLWDPQTTVIQPRALVLYSVVIIALIVVALALV